MPYLWLKTFHVLLAIVAVGFSISYGLIIGRARRAGRVELTFALGLGFGVAGPTLRKQITVLEARGPEDDSGMVRRSLRSGSQPTPE